MGKEWEAKQMARTNYTKVLRQEKNVATGQGTKKSVWQEPSNQGKKKASEWRGRNHTTQDLTEALSSLRSMGSH